jgi:hypothetical protein
MFPTAVISDKCGTAGNAAQIYVAIAQGKMTS